MIMKRSSKQLAIAALGAVLAGGLTVGGLYTLNQGNESSTTYSSSVSASAIAGNNTTDSTNFSGSSSKSTAQNQGSTELPVSDNTASTTGDAASTSGSTSSSQSATALSVDESEIFTNRDLTQTADKTDATYITVSDGEDVNITAAGVYVISGTASDVTIRVDADGEKVQLVLDDLNITNEDAPAIYVIAADKVFVTTEGDSTLSVTGTFVAEDSTNLDGVIFAKDDLVLNGTATLTISSTANGIVAKDDLKVTGGTYVIDATSDGVEVNDSIAVNDGTFVITCGKDAFHCENDEDYTLGDVYIAGGSFTLNAGDDGIQATTTLTIDGGTFDITAVEGLEATYITINDGTIDISASDDGINATQKSTYYDVWIEINGGDITIVMGNGDTDAIDANGSIVINGGTIDITANSPFDYDQSGTINGGTVTVNGEVVTTMTNQMMGGMMGGPGMMGGSMDGTNPFGSGTAPDMGSSDSSGMPSGAPSGNMNGGFGGRGGRMQ
ncbi:MAG: carbohydrate-binding domain-containing protein [Lachnospiraceae bacterium]|nr:carbohydrate-binding domain-containing protein [Lachnospiraceae bacterium]